MLPAISELPLSDNEKLNFSVVDSLSIKFGKKNHQNELKDLSNDDQMHNDQFEINKEIYKLNQKNNTKKCQCQNNFQYYYLPYYQFYSNYQNKLYQTHLIQNQFYNYQKQIIYSGTLNQNNKDKFINNQLFFNILSDRSQNIINENQSNNISIKKIKGFWKHEEDEKLIAAVKETNPCVWEIVASKVPGRTPIQCKERWLYRLHPDVNKAKFEKWEDDLIIKERKKMGNSWTYIATKLKGRTALAVKNRWYSILRKEVE